MTATTTVDLSGHSGDFESPTVATHEAKATIPRSKLGYANQSHFDHRSRAPRSSKSLKLQRLYTTAGVHPYDDPSIVWELRDVTQTNWKSGETIFEQHAVEFPTLWSVTAGTIVTTKYFRGALGTKQREGSLKTLINRVVGKYVEAARVNKYFDGDDDYEIFEHELTYMLLHQIFSFNSPVWFNVGTAEPQQVSACFILNVDDTMDGILNWYTEEGLI